MNTQVAQVSREVEEDEEEAVHETSGLVQQALQELRDCLCRIEDKAAYLQACFCTPHLIETESDPLWFLRVERFHASAAAQRLVNYWKERVLAFGDRAFLPLTDLTGEGALSPEDIRILRTQFWNPLPNDSAGRPVLVFDLSRLCSSQTLLGTAPASRRIFFYLAVKLSSNPNFHTSGVVDLRCVRATGFVGENLRRCMVLASQALPFKWHRIHLCCVPTPESRKLFSKTVLPVMLHVFEEVLPGRVVVHVGTSEEDMMERMSKLGLDSAGVPTQLGGKWTYPNPDDDCFAVFAETQREKEINGEEKQAGRHTKRLKVAPPSSAPSSIPASSGPTRLMLQALLDMKRQKVGSMRQLLRTPVIQQRALDHLAEASAKKRVAVAGTEEVPRARQDTRSLPEAKPSPASSLTTVTLEAELRQTAARKRLLLALRGKVQDKARLQAPKAFAGLPAPNMSRRQALGARVAEILQNHGIKKRI